METFPPAKLLYEWMFKICSPSILGFVIKGISFKKNFKIILL